jgi:hypothetical protein
MKKLLAIFCLITCYALTSCEKTLPSAILPTLEKNIWNLLFYWMPAGRQMR